MDALIENSLMLQVKNGDLRKMSLLYQRYRQPLFAYLFHQTGKRNESEDLVQTVFYLMLKNRHTFSADGAFRAWMYQIARNTLINSIKKNNRIVYQAEFETQPLEHELEHNYDHQEARAQLNQAIARLPDDQREVLILSKYQELSYKEIATVLKTTEGNVKVKVFRAIQVLKKLHKK
ncbi:RNA polymerase sigma factor [Mucilaginibacter sp.]|jgi:RNA polymerase sigma-70 factor (ECF subfamily)|uniref:RNA polymerase sigma factor n=1 Tax=Mucilaginibacter sp. TaxID=1882438 RepID=UPI003566ACCA